MTNCRNDAGSFTASGSGLSSVLAAARCCRPRPDRGAAAAASGRRAASRSRSPRRSPSAPSCRPSPPCFAFWTVLRLTIPRTGRRSEKIHPTPGTGLPPISRPGSNSHSYSAWNSWNESFERTVPARAVRDLQQEPVAATDRARGRRDDLARGLGLGERGPLGRVDAVLEARVDDDGRDRAGVLGVERRDRLLQLGEARLGASLGGEVRSVDHEVVSHVSSPVTPSRSAAISRSSL